MIMKKIKNSDLFVWGYLDSECLMYWSLLVNIIFFFCFDKIIFIVYNILFLELLMFFKCILKFMLWLII